MPWGAAIAAVGAIGSAVVGAKGAEGAQQQVLRADQSADLGFGLTQSRADGTIVQDQNQFTDLSRLFAGQSQQALQNAQVPQFDLNATGFNAGAIGQAQGQVQNQFGNLQGAIQQQGQNQFDPNAFAATQFDRLNSLASRGDELAANRTANNLFSSGRLGANDTATGAAFEGLARGQEQGRTQRALQATQLANSEAQRLFQQGQVGIQNQFGLSAQLQGNQQNTAQNFLGLQGFQNQFQQQQNQNALGFGAGAGTVLNPNFQSLTAVLNAQSTDQSARAGVQSTNNKIAANSAQATADSIGNAFGGIGTAVTNARA